MTFAEFLKNMDSITPLGNAIAIILTAPISFILIRSIIRRTKRMFFNATVKISKVMFILNTLLASILFSSPLYSIVGLFAPKFVQTGWFMLINLFLICFFYTILHTMAHSSEHPKLEYWIHFIYGAIDGIIIGVMIATQLLPKYMEEVTIVHKAFTIIITFVIAMVLTFKERHRVDYFVE